MQRGVEEREQSEHPPQLDQLVPAGDAPKRCDRESNREEGDRPGARLVGDVVARVGGERAQVAQDECRVETASKRRGGDQRRGEDQNFDDRDRLQ